MIISFTFRFSIMMMSKDKIFNDSRTLPSVTNYQHLHQLNPNLDGFFLGNQSSTQFLFYIFSSILLVKPSSFSWFLLYFPFYYFKIFRFYYLSLTSDPCFLSISLYIIWKWNKIALQSFPEFILLNDFCRLRLTIFLTLFR